MNAIETAKQALRNAMWKAPIEDQSDYEQCIAELDELAQQQELTTQQLQRLEEGILSAYRALDENDQYRRIETLKKLIER